MYMTKSTLLLARSDQRLAVPLRSTLLLRFTITKVTSNCDDDGRNRIPRSRWVLHTPGHKG